MKILVSWSTGKDSAWMLQTLRQQHPGAVSGF
jgi:diphthamide synthase (EF-2-diphthine--ammonia ligase)